MIELLFVVALIAASFTGGSLDGNQQGKREIAEACLKKGSFEFNGHTFKCERTKIREGL